ncbi:AAA family ATPase [Prosthecobacter algae]|uniref:AAA family ATPase n=1 Tax=Prosthecobacter algae TaxID=1144682 RepID=A0ABP9PGQ8_9BACT
MLKSLHIENLTVFPNAELKFGKNLNIIIGENGSGKSHLLKTVYCALAVSAEGKKGTAQGVPARDFLAKAFADKLRGVFRPDTLGRLARRTQGHTTCRLEYHFKQEALDFSVQFSTRTKAEVVVDKSPSAWLEKKPVFLPTRELLSIYPGFSSLYKETHLPFEETWNDTCLLLGAPLARGPREPRIKYLLRPLESAMGGNVELDKSGRFYLNTNTGSMEMHLVAEGLRKLAMVARLIATGSLLDKGYLFWDEPESNLNPKIIKTIARSILELAHKGIQVFIASHSLFLLRELHILQHSPGFQGLDTRCFGLHLESCGKVIIQQGRTMDDVGEIAALDEDLQQSERYIDNEMGVPDQAAGSDSSKA